MKTTKFNPIKFLGKGWSIESDNGFNPDDLSNITLGNYLHKGETYITGEQVLERINAKGDKGLNADAFLRFWENKDLIPKAWYDTAYKGYIEFTGTILRGSYGLRCFLCLDRGDDGSWGWYCGWLGSVRGATSVSVRLASSSLDSDTQNSPSDTLPLVLKINGFTYKREI